MIVELHQEQPEGASVVRSQRVPVSYHKSCRMVRQELSELTAIYFLRSYAVNTISRVRVSVATAVVLTMASSAWASFIEADASSVTDNFNSVISATDLINVGQGSLSSTSNPTLLGGSVPGLHDGVGQTWDVLNGNVAFLLGPTTFEFSLNTNSATGGSAAGYTLSKVDCVAGWVGAGQFANQNWTLKVQTLTNPGVWSDVLATVGYAPYADPSGTGFTHVTLTDSAATATGVTAVQIAFIQPGMAVISEVDVAGTATVPEPGVIMLLATGLFGLLAYAWRRHK